MFKGRVNNERKPLTCFNKWVRICMYTKAYKRKGENKMKTVIKQVDLNEIKDRDYRKYAKSILRTYENEYKELLENAED